MSQFGGPKNPGWAGQPGLGAGLFSGQLGGLGGAGAAGGPQAFAGLGQMGGLVPGLGLNVNAAAFSHAPNVNMNMLQAQQAQMQANARAAVLQQTVGRAPAGMIPQIPQQAPQAAAAAQQQKNQRTFVGVVTKMHDNYGFVDDDVFFQHNVIRGAHPRTGDRVMVEATYNPQMPFKWNAFRIQLLPTSGAPADTAQAAPRAAATSTTTSQRWGPQTTSTPAAPSRRDPSPRRRSPPPRRASPRRSPPRRSPTRRSPPPRRASPRRSPPRRTSPVPRREATKRERSPSAAGSSSTAVANHRRDSASPPRRRQRIIPRYVVNVPKPLLIGSSLSVVHLRKRYTHLYVPSDFADFSVLWPDTVPVDSSLQLSGPPVSFHVFNKDIDFFEPSTLPVWEASDADHRYQVKVLLLAHPGQTALHQKAYGLLPDGSTDETCEPTSLFKHIQFLVGTRGGKETMALGGSWSPSLDGPDPTNTATLIRTAIRTVLALTGVNLASCAQWYQLAQLRYFRTERRRVDSVLLLLPDTSSLVPTADQRALNETHLKVQLAEKLAALDASATVATTPATPNSGSNVPSADTDSPSRQGSVETALKDEEPQIEGKEEAADGKSEEAEEQKEEGAPTHWSKLDVKALKVAELREELEARGLETKGIKTMLVQRLQEAVEKEEKEEKEKLQNQPPEVKEEKPTDEDLKEEVKKEENGDPAAKIADPAPPEKTEEQKKAETEAAKKAAEKAEKERKERKQQLEKRFVMPKEQKVLVFPNKNAKAGKFDCKVMSLQSLLEYRQEDNKEASFEVSVYAEAFRELLERNAAFGVYAAVAQAPEREDEKKRRDAAKEGPKEDDEKDVEMKEEDKKDDADKEVDKKKKEEKKEELKEVVSRRDIFHNFSLFDQNQCGYIIEKDLEEIILSAGLSIPRGLLTKLVKKLSQREKINYRHLTDKLVDKNGETRYEPSTLDDPNLATDNLALGYGQRFVEATESLEAPDSGVMTAADEGGIVTYKGQVVNLAQNLSQLKKLEADRDTALAKIHEQEVQLKSAKETREGLEKKKKRLEDDVDKYRKRVHELEKTLKNSQDDTVSVRTALQECKKLGDRISHLVEKAMPSKKKEDKEEEKKEEKAATDEDKKKESPVENGKKEEAGYEEAMDTDIVLAEEVGQDDDDKEDKDKAADKNAA